MKKVIFTKDWMAFHPYDKPNDVDLYYTELANNIYHELDESCFVHQFQNVDNAKRLAICIAEYFEDVLSGTCIWKAFTTECKKRYGVYVPFYQDGYLHDTDVERFGKEKATYNPDEINLADIKFLLWHHYQLSCYHQDVIPPLFSTIDIAAKLVYDILDAEYETAPDNERLYQFLCELPATEDTPEVYTNVVDWVHYGCFLNTGNDIRLINDFRELQRRGEYNPMLGEAIKADHMVFYRNIMLGLTSPEWLAKISEFHPAHKLWTNVEFREGRPLLIEKIDDKFIYAKDLIEEDEVQINRSSLRVEEDFDYTPFLQGEQFLKTSLFKLGDYWNLHNMGRTFDYNDKTQEEIKAVKEQLSHKRPLADYALLKEHGYDNKFIFLEDKKALMNFFESIGFKKPAGVTFPPTVPKGIIVSGSPYTGINVTFGLAHCIYSESNPYYDEIKAQIDDINIIAGNGLALPYELVCRLIDSNMLPDASVFTSKYVKEEGLRITQENLQFLVDYYFMGRRDKDLSPAELW